MGGEIDALLRSYRKKRLFETDALPELSYGTQQIAQLIPHRPPYLLVDRISHVSYQQELIAGNKYIAPDDPYLEGHFPDNPIYPGMLMLECLGQLALSLYYFVMQQSNHIAERRSIPAIFLTKVLGAHFLNPLVPQSSVELLAMNIKHTGLFNRAIAQSLVDDRVSVVMAGEVYIADESLPT